MSTPLKSALAALGALLCGWLSYYAALTADDRAGPSVLLVWHFMATLGMGVGFVVCVMAAVFCWED